MSWGKAEKGHGGTTYTGEVTAGDATLVTAIFLPDRFHTSPGADLILYYHGWTTAYGAKDIGQLIVYRRNAPMRDAVAKDGRFALVIPWLGEKPNRMTIYKGITGSAQAFEAYLAGVAAAIQAATGAAAAQDVGRLVLAAHSGGGKPLNETIALHSKFSDKAISAWCFDCFYNISTSHWLAWKQAREERSILCCFTVGSDPDNSTAEESGDLKAALTHARQKNFVVKRSEVGHHDIPGHYFPEFLAATSFTP